MRLFIAEKPSVAKAIATELGISEKGDGYIKCNNDYVTWCFGHMLELAGPDDYTPNNVPTNRNGKKIWRVDELPIIPDKWILRPKEDAKKQINIISNLLKQASQIVHAGDPDREGQLLIDELLDYFNNKKLVLRYWANAIDSVSINRALANMKDNQEYKGFANAAEGRGKADWLIGMNLSRAYTLKAQRGGSRELLTVGRVQTPTLALVVTRDREIESFKPISFHTICAQIQYQNKIFLANWKAKEDQKGLDNEGRLVDTSIANFLVESLTGKTGSIIEYKQEANKQNHPLAFSLSDITTLASKKFGYSAEDILKTCQSLYEIHKLTTYPRTNCCYLPESQFLDAPNVLEAIKIVNPNLAPIVDRADTNIKSRIWNDKKVSAHHGIIPTMHKGNLNKLNDKELNLYDLIVKTYLAQFYPIHEFMSTNVIINIEGEIFNAKGKLITKNGWHDVYQDSLDENDSNNKEENQSLPKMSPGDVITCNQITRKDAKTKPPARFTEGTLVAAMVNIHRFISDPKHKKILREGDGIGTEATRASIISELKRRNYLENKGKQIISTTLGRNIIDVLPEVVKSPVLTALYERMLQSIESESGNSNLITFISKQEQFIRDQVDKANEGSICIANTNSVTSVSDLFKCSSCGAGLCRRPNSKKKGSFWWGCSNYPTCKQTYPDIKGRPNYSNEQRINKL